MNDVCTDNRFEVIAKAKEALLDSTNIDTSPDEMACLNNFLFRCWQMGWLDKYEKDLVEVVRCKNCRHNGSFDTDCPFGWRDERFNLPDDMDFCSYGER